MASKEIICYYCKKTQNAILNDSKGNVICVSCKKVIFAVTEEDEDSLMNYISLNSHNSYVGGTYVKKEPLAIKTCCSIHEEITKKDEEYANLI